MAHTRGIFMALLLWGAIMAVPRRGRAQETGFLNRVVKVDGVEYRYQVYVPASWSNEKKWPVILFLHGYGEEGDDGLLQTEVGIGTAIRQHPYWFPCIVVLPQCRKEDWWTNRKMEAQALKALDESTREFKGDPRRVYLTGLSMGGYGTWDLGAKYPGTFAALVPICGGIRLPPGDAIPNAHDTENSPDPYAAIAEKIGRTPVWVFHGDADPTVPVTESRKMVQALKAAGGSVRYSEYPGVEHNSWDKAYAEPALWTWLFSQKLAETQ